MTTGWANQADDKYNEGTQLFKQANYEAAVVAFTQCIELLPHGAPGYGCYASRGAAKNNLGLFDAAIADASEAIKRYDGDYALGYYVRGYSYIKKAEYDKALADLQKALRSAQSLKEGVLKYIYRELGRVYYAQDLYAQAVDNLKKAIAIDQKLQSANWWLGSAFEKMGKSAEAIIAYENFIKNSKPGDSNIEEANQRIEKLSKE
ncbi:MAG TPA: tetratricopeptide repeat protein [Negativicutes bacterium]|nr:tetratricopeptide repeat protein [Negativicutes bacterium]